MKALALQENYETKIEYHCVGAQMRNVQPGDVDGMVNAARGYAQDNRGGKFHAILWPFSALNSYNVAEHGYQGDRPIWQRSGGHLLKMLNLEYAKLQRLEHTLAGLPLVPKSDTRDAMKIVSCVTWPAADSAHKPCCRHASQVKAAVKRCQSFLCLTAFTSCTWQQAS